MKTKKIWELIIECAQNLTDDGIVLFTRQDIVGRIQIRHPDIGADSINPIIQGLTDNLQNGVSSAGGKNVLHRVGRGQFELISNIATIEPQTAPMASTEASSPTKGQEQENRLSPPSRISDKLKPLDANMALEKLSPKQRKKLRVAAEILKRTADLYDGTEYLLPHWGAGVVTWGQPTSKDYVIGITHDADKQKGDLTRDHLYRVTATAEYILTRANELSIEEIEKILLSRSVKMTVTRTQNHNVLKGALKKCQNKDDWQELYRVAGIEYRLY